MEIEYEKKPNEINKTNISGKELFWRKLKIFLLTFNSWEIIHASRTLLSFN
jgi:hypothetical protein